MHRRTSSISWLFAIAVPALLVSPARAEDDHRKHAPDDKGELIWMLHHDNMAEMQMGKLAQKNAKSSQVRAFGKQLASDHAKANKKVMAYAKANNITLAMPSKDDTDDKAKSQEKDKKATGDKAADAQKLPDDPMAKHHQEMMRKHMDTMARLKDLKGAEFDREFLTTMVDDHRTTLDMVTAAKDKVNDQKLKDILTELQPALQKHHDKGVQLRDQLGFRAARTEGEPPRGDRGSAGTMDKPEGTMDKNQGTGTTDRSKEQGQNPSYPK